MTNKVLGEKSNCVACRSSKSLSLQKQKIVLTSYKDMHIYCKTCKKNTSNTFPKKLVLISKNEFKGKSKWAIFLTERTFIYKIEGKYEIESELEIYLQFFTDWCY